MGASWGGPAGLGAGRITRRKDDNGNDFPEVVEMNARQRREAAGFVAAGGSFETYPAWGELVLRALFARLVRRTARPAGRSVAGRWSR